MKARNNQIPFHYQISYEDCFPTSVMNALIRLYEQCEIPAEVIRMVYLLSLDDPRVDMSTREGAMALITWLTEYQKNKNRRKKKKNFFIEAKILEGTKVNLGENNEICKYLDSDGVALCDIRYPDYNPKVKHTILALRHDLDWIYFWDPYYGKGKGESIPKRCNKDVKRIDRDERWNLKITKQWLDKDTDDVYTFGKEDRFCILMKKGTCVR